MKTECNAAHGIAARISLMLILPLLLLAKPLLANEITDASLIKAQSLHAGPWSERVSIQIGNRVEHLLLNPHDDLNNIDIVDSDGRPQAPQSATAYTGIIESLPTSWARLLIDGDYIAGTINAGTHATSFTSESAGSLAAIGFGSTDLVLIPPPQAGSNDRSILSISTPNGTLFEDIPVPVNNQLNDPAGNVSRVISIGIVVDSLYQEAIGGRGLSKALSTINSVDGLYREKFGLALKLDTVVLVTDDTTLSLDAGTLEDNLALFRDYRISSELLPDDLGLVHLFTGVEAQDDSIGLAYKGAACRTDGYDVSISRPFQYPVLLTAHEIGHNLGADHDDATEDCLHINDRLMFSTINSGTTREFSSCSNDSINTRMEQSTCFTAAIDIDLQITQLESNQVLATVANLDNGRAFPSATLHLDLKNATVSEAPAICELQDPSRLECTIPATFAGESHEVAVKLRLTPNLERTVTMRLEPNGFFDLNDQNNLQELVIPGEPQPLAVTGGELTTQGAGSTGNAGAGSSGAANTGGGGQFGFAAILLLALIRLVTRDFYPVRSASPGRPHRPTRTT